MIKNIVAFLRSDVRQPRGIFNTILVVLALATVFWQLWNTFAADRKTVTRLDDGSGGLLYLISDLAEKGSEKVSRKQYADAAYIYLAMSALSEDVQPAGSSRRASTQTQRVGPTNEEKLAYRMFQLAGLGEDYHQILLKKYPLWSKP